MSIEKRSFTSDWTTRPEQQLLPFQYGHMVAHARGYDDVQVREDGADSRRHPEVEPYRSR